MAVFERHVLGPYHRPRSIEELFGRCHIFVEGLSVVLRGGVGLDTLRAVCLSFPRYLLFTTSEIERRFNSIDIEVGVNFTARAAGRTTRGSVRVTIGPTI